MRVRLGAATPGGAAEEGVATVPQSTQLYITYIIVRRQGRRDSGLRWTTWTGTTSTGEGSEDLLAQHDFQPSKGL